MDLSIKPSQRSIQNRQFEQLTSLALSTDNNNISIWLLLLLCIIYQCKIHGNMMKINPV